MIDVKTLKCIISKLIVIQNIPLHIDVALAVIVSFLSEEIEILSDGTGVANAYLSLQKLSKTFFRRNAHLMGDTSSFAKKCVLGQQWWSSQPLNVKIQEFQKLELRLVSSIEEEYGHLAFDNNLYDSYRKALDRGIDGKEIRFFEWQPVDSELLYVQEEIEVVGDLTLANNHTIMENADVVNGLKNFIYDEFPLDQYPRGLNTYEYMWQYKLSQDAYLKLKCLLSQLPADYISRRNNLRQECAVYGNGSINVTLAQIIFLLLTEWYKRECNSLDGAHAYDELGLPNISELLWEALGLSNEYLYNNDNGNNMRLNAMCVFGGFPLMYVNRAGRFSALINALSDLKEANDDIEVIVENVIGEFDENNNIFSSSLKYGSCRKYIEQLAIYLQSRKIEDLPFSIHDIDQKTFRGFVDNIENGYANKVRSNYLSGEYLFWIDAENEIISCDYRLRIGFKNDKNVVSCRDMYLLGIDIPNDIDFFKLKLTAHMLNNSVVESCCKHYMRVGNGNDDFSCFGSSVLSIDNVDIDNVSRFVVSVEYDNGQEQDLNYFQEMVPSLFELYLSENNCWTNKTSVKAVKSLLVNMHNYLLRSDWRHNAKTFEKNSSSLWMWGVQTENVNLFDNVRNTEQVIIFRTSGKVSIDFMSSELKKSLRLDGNSCVKLYDENIDLDAVPLLYSSFSNPSLNIKVYIPDEDNEGHRRQVTNYLVEFKSNVENRYTKFPNINIKQGLTKIRVSCGEPGKYTPWEGYVYFIPSSQPVVRNLENRIIKFDMNDVYELNGDLNKVTDYQEKDETTLDSIPFQVGKPDSFVIINVIRAFHLGELYRGKTRVSQRFGNAVYDVAWSMQKEYQSRIIDESGVKYTNFNEILYLDYLQSPKDLMKYFVESRDLKMYIYRPQTDDGDNPIRTIDNEQRLLRLQVSEEYASQYIFYFFSGWRLSRLNSEYDSNKKTLNVDLSSAYSDGGIIFQSLKDCCPNHYYSPIFTSTDSIPIDRRWDYIMDGLRQQCTTERLVKLYDLSQEHNIYFFTFPQFSKFFLKRPNRAGHVSENVDVEIRVEFLKMLLKSRNYVLNSDLDALTRLAMETSFDWILLPRRKWISIINSCPDNLKEELQKSILALFAKSPMLKKGSSYHVNALHFFKYIFNNRYFERDEIFCSTSSKRRNEERLFVECLNGTTIQSEDCRNLLKKITNTQEHYPIFRKVYENYLIKQL